MRWAMVWGVAWTVTVSPLVGQGIEGGRAGPRAELERSYEVQLARSAAPDDVSRDARVLAWNGERFVEARGGTNGVTCYVSRSWPESLEPHCFDEEGSRTILPMHLKRVEMQHQGFDAPAIDAEIAQGLADGTYRLPTRPVMSYMMSAAQKLINDQGQPAGSWKPHLMIYFPYLTEAALGLGTVPSTEAAMVVDPGTPFSNIMIVVEDFVAGPAGTQGGDAHER